MKTINPFKIRNLTPEQSKVVEECLFKNEYNLENGTTIINSNFDNLVLNKKRLSIKYDTVYC